MFNRIKNPVITATPNHSQRTFTIRKKWKDGTTAKYRTIPSRSKQEFETDLNMTPNDWKQFLRDCDGEYHVIR